MSPIKHELLKGMNHVLSYFVSLGNNIVPQYIVATQLIFAEWICGKNAYDYHLGSYCDTHGIYCFIASQQSLEAGAGSSERESNLPNITYLTGDWI